MIIIGSYAAKLGGFYPSWRKDSPKDVDIVCKVSEFFQTISILGKNPVFVKPNHALILGKSLPYELTTVPDDIYSLMTSEESLISELNITASVASPEVVWATLYYTAGCVQRNFEKSFKDLFHYQDIVSDLNDHHWEIAQYYRKRMIEHIRTVMEKKNDSN